MTLFLLCVAALVAGFVDAVVGGGGLVQTPAALILLPQHPVATVMATVKIPSFTGTLFAARKYARRVTLQWRLLVLHCMVAAVASGTGSWLLTRVSNQYMKPLLLVVLTAVAVYTFANKNFGQQQGRALPVGTLRWRGAALCAAIGFYDGFIGPGTGAFLLLALVIFLGFDFLAASAHAKVINLATNGGSILLFLSRGQILWKIALAMAVCNAVGAYLGSSMALKHGNVFIRRLFLVVVIATLIRFAWDLWPK